MRETLSILKFEPSYSKLLFANFISGIGSWFSSVAILSLLLQLTGAGTAIGITMAARTLPFLIMGPIGGVLADTFNKKWLLIISDLAKILLVLCLLFVNTADQLWIVYSVTVGIVMFTAISAPARSSLIPQLVSKQNTPSANALDQSLNGINMTLGASLGGVVSALLGPETSFILNACTFLLSAILVYFIPYSSKLLFSSSTEVLENTIEAPSLWKEMRQSLFLKIVVVQAFIWPIGGGAINVLISVYGYEVFGAGDTGIGVLYAALGAGFLISGLIASYFKRWMIQVVILSTVIEGLSHVFVSQSSTLWLGTVFILTATVGAGIGNASFASLMMTLVNERVLGKSFAMDATVSNVMMAVSMLVTGVLLEFVPAQTIGFYAGLLIMTTSLTALPLLGKAKEVRDQMQCDETSQKEYKSS